MRELSTREDAGKEPEPSDDTNRFWESFFFDGGLRYTNEMLAGEGLPAQGTFFLVLLCLAIPEAMREDEGYIASVLRLLREIVQKQ